MKTSSALASALVVLSFGCAVPEGANVSGGGADGASALKPAPDLTLDKIDGSGQLALSDQRGKVVLVDLWATWCAPCIAELPTLQKMSERFGPDDFLMLGIVLESGDANEVREFVEKKEIHYPQVMGEDGTKESFGPFLGYPTKYLIDRDGRIVKRYFGAVGDELASDIEALITTGTLAKEATS